MNDRNSRDYKKPYEVKQSNGRGRKEDRVIEEF